MDVVFRLLLSCPYLVRRWWTVYGKREKWYNSSGRVADNRWYYPTHHFINDVLLDFLKRHY